MLELFAIFGLVAVLVLVLLFFKVLFALLLWPFRVAFWLIGALIALVLLPFQLVGGALLLVLLVPAVLVGLPLLLVVGVPLLIVGGALLGVGLLVGGIAAVGGLILGH